jgi:hypothetical protein
MDQSAATTDTHPLITGDARPPVRAAMRARPHHPAAAKPTGSGPDRLSVILFSLAAVLVVLALLARQLNTGTTGTARHAVLMRRIYRTTIVETVPGPGSGTSVSQSVSSSGSGVSGLAVPTSRTS